LTLLLGRDHPLTSLISNAYTMGSEVHDVAIELKESGSTSQFLTSIFSLGQGPEPPGLLLIVRDLDPVQKLESVVDYSGRLARLGALISGVAHQIRNPLNAMNLQLELLSQDAERGASVTPRLESVRSQIRKLDQVINALLRFMRPEELRLADVPVNELVSDIGGQVGNSGIEVVYELDPEAPSASIDRGLVAEAIKNIVTNAVEAMPNGGKLTLRTGTVDREWVEIAIKDEGTGISPADIDQIFHLYFTTKQSGSGLGLSLALRAIDLHHGTVDVESQPGEGTTFLIRLPKVKQRADQEIPAQVLRRANA